MILDRLINVGAVAVWMGLLYPFPAWAATALAREHQESLTTSHSASELYQTGFAHLVRENSSGDGVVLDDMMLIDTDGPGAGYSQKGEFREPIHQGVRARKTLWLDDPAAYRAHCVLFMAPLSPSRQSQAPFEVRINGQRLSSPPLSFHEPEWHWIEFPPQWLARGENEIVVSCDAPEGEGYNLLFARADEFEGGGGAFTWRGGTGYAAMGHLPFGHDEDEIIPFKVGSGSSRSTDGGVNWSPGLGPGGNVTGEYTIRLNLQRYQATGELHSRAIDLWADGERWNAISPQKTVDALRVRGVGHTPEGTRLLWSIRFGDTPDMTSTSWEGFQQIGEGPGGTWEAGPAPNRYAQLRVQLQTDKPLVTPRVDSLEIERTLRWQESALSDFAVVNEENVHHLYSSFHQPQEDSNHPRLAEASKRLGIGAVVRDARGDFERINLLRHHVSTLWKHALPEPEYPAWDTLAILDRNERLGWGGMCMQFVVVFMQSLQSEGYLARHINMFAHETVEVYVNELDRWAIVDPESVFDSYSFDRQTGLPLSALDQHAAFLRTFGLSRENPIRWKAIEPWGWPAPDLFPQDIGFSTSTPRLANPDKPPPQYRLAGFVRMIPRTDFLSNPAPVPVNNGLYLAWPWTGYLNWFDEATPRKLQYGIHTDRHCDFYPTVHRVEFAGILDPVAGTVELALVTQTPNFESFEVRGNEGSWVDSPARMAWALRPGAVNSLEMRVRNKAGRTGKPSRVEMVWHQRPAYDGGK